MSATLSDSRARAPARRFLILACSPRAGGNSDAAARLFARSFAATAGGEARTLFLRSLRVRACVACGGCARLARDIRAQRPDYPDRPAAALGLFTRSPAFGCPLCLEDQSAALLKDLASASGLCLVSPVYFYHLPAALKALVDRLQIFWSLREAGLDVFTASERPCRVILIGARKRGDKLFEGSLLTLRYALAGLGFYLAEPLLLHGLDGPGDLEGEAGARERVTGYGALAGGLSLGEADV